MTPLSRKIGKAQPPVEAFRRAAQAARREDAGVAEK